MKAARVLAMAVAALIAVTTPALAQRHAALSQAETDKLRDTQDPGGRIKLYLDLMQVRLQTFDEYRNRPVNPEYKTGKFLAEVMGQYVKLDDELKDWIQFQYNRDGDMRKGLRALLDDGPKQLSELQHFQQTPDPYTARYKDQLGNALADLADTLDGATQAMSGQEKKLGQLKAREKQAGKTSNTAIKEEKKRIKEEEKLRKKERKQRQESGSDEN
ncbi:MAG TPA: hypothetical protein VFZ08_02270 [Terriglobia bacterium]|nr:hypothetical protein [Terriglobia bacterium]